MTQDHTVLKTLVEQSSDNVSKLSATMGSLQKSVQDVQANSGARLDTMSTQVQGLSDNLEEIKSRLGKAQSAARRPPELRAKHRRANFRRRSCHFPSNGTPTGAGGAAHSNETFFSATQACRNPRSSGPPRPRTRSIPMASATSPAANTISPATNFRTTSDITVTPISPPTRSSISAKLPTPRNNTM